MFYLRNRTRTGCRLEKNAIRFVHHQYFQCFDFVGDQDTVPSDDSTPVRHGLLFRRNIQAALNRLHAIRDGAAETIGSELARSLPTLTARQTAPQRPRRINRDTRDKRRSTDVKCKITALDKPSYRSTTQHNLETLSAKGLGRPSNQTYSFPLHWKRQEIEEKIRQIFPVLQDVTFSIHLGLPRCQLYQLTEVSAEEIRRLKGSQRAAIWVLPDVEITHFPLGTPTVLGRVLRIERNIELPTMANDALPSEPMNDLVTTRDDHQQDFSGHNAEITEPLNELSQTDNQEHEPVNDEQLRQDEIMGPLLLDVTDESMADSNTDGSQILVLSRSCLFEETMEIYDRININKPLSIRFSGEQGVDQGGLTKEFFTSFWAVAVSRYFAGRESKVPFMPIGKRTIAKEIFPLLGKILAHMFILLKVFPAGLSVVTIYSLFNEDVEVPSTVLISELLDYLPEAESDLLKKCMGTSEWTDSDKRRLVRFFSVNQITTLPNEMNIRDTLLNIGQYKLIDSTLSLVHLMRKGIQSETRRLLSLELGLEQIITVINSQKCTASEIADLIDSFEEASDLSPLEVIMVSHISNCVREMNTNHLTSFLRWLTGSAAKPIEIKISFNASTGLQRVPIAHTCGNLLEVSTQYETYEEFKHDLLSVICSSEAFEFNIM